LPCGQHFLHRPCGQHRSAPTMVISHASSPSSNQ
jgi:hypothetical protein